MSEETLDDEALETDRRPIDGRDRPKGRFVERPGADAPDDDVPEPDAAFRAKAERVDPSDRAHADRAHAAMRARAEVKAHVRDGHGKGYTRRMAEVPTAFVKAQDASSRNRGSGTASARRVTSDVASDSHKPSYGT